MVRKALEQRPDVVLMDVSMPGINGFAAARFIKQGLPSTVILMVSQFESAPFERDALAAGATAYMFEEQRLDRINSRLASDTVVETILIPVANPRGDSTR